MTDLRERLRSGPAMFGAICSVPDSFSAEVLGRAGFDWVCVDLQHGMIDQADLLGILQGLAVGGTPALVRVPWNEPASIMRALDTGAAGVVIPMVSSARDAAAAVAACRYPPAGIRSWGPTRAALGRGDYGVETADREVLCAVMIETREAMDALDEILAVPGVDVAFIGPSDLAIAHGSAPSLQADDPDIGRRILQVREACARHDVIPAIFTSGPEAASRWERAGFRLLTVGSDRLLMLEAARRLMASIRSAAAEPDEP
jgi:4-hydroxy-2-oxoheptanedioate aldolase